MAFLPFGARHHDIALFPAPKGAELGRMGLNHFAMRIDAVQGNPADDSTVSNLVRNSCGGERSDRRIKPISVL